MARYRYFAIKPTEEDDRGSLTGEFGSDEEAAWAAQKLADYHASRVCLFRQTTGQAEEVLPTVEPSTAVQRLAEDSRLRGQAREILARHVNAEDAVVQLLREQG